MPDVDLASVIEVAVMEKLERLEARRFGKTKKLPNAIEEADTSPGSPCYGKEVIGPVSSLRTNVPPNLFPVSFVPDRSSLRFTWSRPSCTSTCEKSPMCNRLHR